MTAIEKQADEQAFWDKTFISVLGGLFSNPETQRHYSRVTLVDTAQEVADQALKIRTSLRS